MTLWRDLVRAISKIFLEAGELKLDVCRSSQSTSSKKLFCLLAICCALFPVLLLQANRFYPIKTSLDILFCLRLGLISQIDLVAVADFMNPRLHQQHGILQYLEGILLISGNRGRYAAVLALQCR